MSQNGKPNNLDNNEFTENFEIKELKDSLVFFRKDDQACKRFNVFFSNLSKKYQQFVFYVTSLDGSLSKNAKEMGYDIYRTPSLVFFSNGKPITKYNEKKLLNEESIDNWIKDLNTKHNKK
uniref:Thioredoxin domain-containing protein n=1 Tax=viral metagenome TaxID=1070528 RepID=A0A6C0JPH6_9ZZZZ